MRPLKILLIAYNGAKSDALNIVKARFANSEITLLTKSDLKKVSKGQVLALLRKRHYDLGVIFCENYSAQRHVFLLKVLGVLIKAEKKIIIDRSCECITIFPSQLVFVELPLFLLLWVTILFALTVVNFLLFIAAIFIKSRARKMSFVDKHEPKLRIAYLRCDNTQVFGGLMSHITGFVNAMLGLKHEIIFVASSIPKYFPHNLTESHIIKPFCVFDKISVEFSQVIYNLKFIFRAYKIVKNRNVDFIYQRHSAFNCAGAILSFLIGKPLMLEFNSSALWKTDELGRLRFKVTRILMERVCLISAKKIMVVSKELKKQLEARGVNSAKIVVNPNGVDPAVFNKSVLQKDLRSMYGIGNKKIVGFAGMFMQWHGVETIARAIKYVIRKNRDVHFVLIGDGSLRHKIEEIVTDDAVSGFISLTGMIPKNEMPAYLNSCDILVSPHRHMSDGRPFFGSPVKIFEYMAMEKPIVASNVGQLGEILQDSKNALLVPPDEPEKLADRILKYIFDQELGEMCGKRAREDLIANYTWEKNAQRVIDTYTEIIKISA